MSFQSPSEAAHDLLRHVPPKDIEDRMYDVIGMNEDLADELLSTVDVPLRVAKDPSTQQDYIKCDYNRDGDSYRSPFTNKYFPDLPDGMLPSQKLREMEELGLKGFQSYLQQYFGSGVISVYCWDIDPDNDVFGVGVFVKKDLDSTLRDGKTPLKGSISCSDVLEISKQNGKNYQYDLVSSVLLDLSIGTTVGEPLTISGGLADKVVKTKSSTSSLEHMINVGEMIEDSTSRFMSKVKQIYVSKMEEILALMKQTSMGGHRGGPGGDRIALAGLTGQIDPAALKVNLRKL